MGASVLIAEDDRDLRHILGLYLEGDGFEVFPTADGTSALAILEERRFSFDLALLDIMLPGLDGHELLRRIRAHGTMPVMIISARNSDQERILGLNLGADDYLGKPFNPLEVVARARALLRRTAYSSEQISIGDLVLDTARCSLRRNGVEVPLTMTEYRILLTMMRSPGRVFTKAQLYTAATGEEAQGAEASIAVHISNLRSKIGDGPHGCPIETLRGLGYRFGA